ncbi:hypothetical protein DAEQUDRAFT_731067 [Daedalea quercina L-15889]|uniref:DUF6534 domain-containing protein n=1 Tax=Daedalea quercina L-15889 TaxID=1314783 RepID=A0A165MJI9_9APHY|nr:hypothetical protein DAEQUDRAFT_731067 [Daedalea quercina L-15889]
MTSDSVYEQLNLSQSIGSTFVGAGIFSAVFYGFANAQLAYYYHHYARSDKWSLKGLIFLLWVLDTISTIGDIYIVWFYVVKGHGSLSILLVIPKIFGLEFATLTMTISIVQLFYIYGIWHMLLDIPRELKVVVTAVPAILSLLSLSMGLVTAHLEVANAYNISKTLLAARVPTLTKVWSAAAADVYICVVLSWLLYQKRTGLRHTDNMIQRLIAYIVHRGILSTVAQIGLCATYLVSLRGGELIWVAFHCAGGKVYVGSMMAVLNARERLRNLSHDVRLSGFADDL